MPMRMWSRLPTKKVFVSLERTPLVLVDVRNALPQLKKDLGKKWQVESVTIELHKPRIKNPTDPTEFIVRGACVGLVVSLLQPSVDVAGKELAKHVRRWLNQFNKTKKKTKRKP
jgi:hypothetical protein